MLELTGAIVQGFRVDGFGSALLGALLLSLVSFALNVLVYDHSRGVYVEVRRF
jgi:uncharacterized membrane protein YvlD (DUF360 family)